jgi:hypothetical protein
VTSPHQFLIQALAVAVYVDQGNYTTILITVLRFDLDSFKPSHHLGEACRSMSIRLIAFRAVDTVKANIDLSIAFLNYEGVAISHLDHLALPSQGRDRDEQCQEHYRTKDFDPSNHGIIPQWLQIGRPCIQGQTAARVAGRGNRGFLAIPFGFASK